MILPTSKFEKLKDKSEFAGEKDVYEHTVRNYCKELINQLIEAFDDLAIESIIFVCEKFLKGEYTPSTTLQTDFDKINILTYTYESANPDHSN